MDFNHFSCLLPRLALRQTVIRLTQTFHKMWMQTSLTWTLLIKHVIHDEIEQGSGYADVTNF